MGTFPRRDDHGVYSTAEVDIRLKRAATTVGVFGSVASLSLSAEAWRQVWVSDMDGRDRREITAQCVFADGHVRVPGSVLAGRYGRLLRLA